MTTTSASPPALNLPGRVYIIRHGERLDHHMSDWCQALHTDRAHDSPLTDEGRFQGRLAGAHVLCRKAAGEGCFPLQTERGDAHFTIISSPLVRCVDTAHHIAESLGVSKVLVDPALIEVGWYMADILQRFGSQVQSSVPTEVAPFCRYVAKAQIEDRQAAVRNGAYSDVREPRMVGTHRSGRGTLLVPQEGLHLPREVLKEHVSSKVCLDYQGLLPDQLSVSQCATTGKMTRADGSELCCVDTSLRCLNALTEPAAASPELDLWRRGADHTLILVGHGDSIHAWYRALTRRPNQPFPSPFEFNCLSELKLGVDAKQRPTYQQVGGYFDTPHLKGTYRAKLTRLVEELDRSSEGPQRQPSKPATHTSSNVCIDTI